MFPIQDYINKCKQKINYHKGQLINAKAWDNAMGLIIVILSATQAFSMTIMTVIGSSAFEIAIVSGTFSLVVIIFSRIKESYQFLSLHYQHSHICEEFTDLHYNLTKSLNNFNNETFNSSEYEKNIVKYSVILNKSHLQHINNCRSLFCCISKYSEELL